MDTASKTITTLKNLVSPLVTTQGLELWGIEVTSTASPTAKIFVDKTCTQSTYNDSQSNYQGVTIEQCTKLSRLIRLALEVEKTFTTTPWTLEISSPGLERPFFALSQLNAYVSQEIQVTLKTPHPLWPNRKKFSGSLINIINETFTLSLSLKQRMPHEPDTICISWSQLHKANLIYNFPEPSKKIRPTKRLGGDIA